MQPRLSRRSSDKVHRVSAASSDDPRTDRNLHDVLILDRRFHNAYTYRPIRPELATKA